jgi:RimJ/RimL family protein N-acetyltransferase
MLEGDKVTLRIVEKEHQETLWRWWNDLEVELAGGGDPPLPISLERLRTRFEREEREGARNKTDFMIETGGASIGHCGLFHADLTARHCELGIHIGEKDYWGRCYEREAVGMRGDAPRLRVQDQELQARVARGSRGERARSGPTELAALSRG